MHVCYFCYLAVVHLTASASFDIPEQSKMKHDEVPERFLHATCDLIQQRAGYQGVSEFILNMMQCGNLTIEDLEQLATEQDHHSELDYKKVALLFGLYDGS